ncbi:MAG: TIGR03668 family PPOX class F420-dependent oxidoreductase [Acidimicrobiia bacterium]
MDRAEALERLGAARVGRFASITPDGRPHVVVVTFAMVGYQLVHMIDQKPKSTRYLQRLQNVETLPVASMLVDHYDEDWSALWWVRVDGEVGIEKDGDLWWTARSRLKEKYRQYRNAPPSGPAIFLTIDRITAWEHG